jgi:hypothetical protein
MDTKVVVGLIVLTAIGTYYVSHSRHHHFEPTKFGDGAILLDTDTGAECSARFDMKWNHDDKKAVWASGLVAKKAEQEYSDFIPVGAETLPSPEPYTGPDFIPASVPNPNVKSLPIPAGAVIGPSPAADSSCWVFTTQDKVEKCNDLFAAMQKADAEYNVLVQKADSEKIPDQNTSYFKNFPLCKDIR